MKKTLIVLFILFLTLFFFLFHDKGNEYLKPYVSSYLETQLRENISVEIEHLKIDLNHLELMAKLNKEMKLNAQGEVSFLSQNLNLDYVLSSDEIQNKVDINGTVKGTFDNFRIKGQGDLTKSTIAYALTVKDDVLSNIQVDINKADITSILALIAQPAYAKGKVDINIDIVSLEEENIQDHAKITLHQSILNQKIFKENLEINLPKNTTLTANLNSKISRKSFQLKGLIKSNLATLKLSQTNYNFNSKELHSNYSLLVPKASKLMFLSKKKLHGKLEIDGTFKSKEDKFNLLGNCKNLGGEIVFDLEKNKLNSKINGVHISKLLYFISEEQYATGKLVGDIQLTNLEEVKGNFKIRSEEAKLKLEENILFSLNTQGNISPTEISLENKIDSAIFQYTSSDMIYDIANQKLNSSYVLQIPKLSRLSTLAGKDLKGKMSIEGKVNYQNELLITGNTKSLDGDIDFVLEAKKINAKINNVSVEKLMETLSYPKLFKATLQGDLIYNLATSRGTFRSTLSQAELLNTYLIGVLREIQNINVSKERYKQSYFNANFKKNFIDIDFKAKSKTVLLSIPFGRIDKASNSITANYKVEVGRKSLEGQIKGDISNPNISVDSSKFIQNNMMNVIKMNMGKDESNMMKDMMNSFFR